MSNTMCRLRFSFVVICLYSRCQSPIYNQHLCNATARHKIDRAVLLSYFIVLVLQIPAFHVPGFTDSSFSCSLFYRFRFFMFLVLQIPSFHVPGFLVPCSVPRSVPRFPVRCFTDSRITVV